MKLKIVKNIEYFDLITWICVFYLFYKFSNLVTAGAWSDRALFFNDGLYSPGVVDILINELFLSLILVVVILGRFRWIYFIFVLTGAVVYFTRSGIIFFLIACMFSLGISRVVKFNILIFSVLGSILILAIRFDGNIPDLDNFLLFYVDYPLIGIGRLLVTEYHNSIDNFSSLTLFFRPLGLVTFSIDYFYSLGGAFSIERFAGILLSEFIYIPMFDEYFNAFGTILFPYFIAFGKIMGSVVFLISIALFFFSLILIFNTSFSVRFCLFLVFSGLLFSWNAPFIWVAPFICRFAFGRRVFQPPTGNLSPLITKEVHADC
jgi:hypothetical protein